MAAITITRGFNIYPDNGVPLVSVHVPTSIEFTFDRGAISGSYAEVVINSVAFRATKILTVGNVDTYQLNGDMLKYFLGLPVFGTSTFSSLCLSCTVVCNGYNSSGSVIATANHSAFKICNAISVDINEGLVLVQSEGRSTTIYHYGTISYFDVTNQIYKSVGSTLTGLYTTDGTSINLVYIPEQWQVAWLNIDGCWDYNAFTRVTETSISKKSNPQSLYADQLVNWVGYEFNAQNDVEEEITFKTIAQNETHYRQLYYITKTPIIVNALGELFELSSPPAPISTCKQNLNFTFTLKRKIHAQSY